MSPFIVLHVCMGNICRSPMAERLLVHAVTQRVGDRADELIVSESVGTGGWHAGERMNSPAEAELRRRGVSSEGFRARKLLAAHIDAADLVLTATSEQLDYVAGLRPDASAKSFVLGEFARLAAAVDQKSLPPYAPTPDAITERGTALVAAADDIRHGAGPRPVDDLDDPWGKGDEFFRTTADQIEDSLQAFVDLLFDTDH